MMLYIPDAIEAAVCGLSFAERATLDEIAARDPRLSRPALYANARAIADALDALAIDEARNDRKEALHERDDAERERDDAVSRAAKAEYRVEMLEDFLRELREKLEVL